MAYSADSFTALEIPTLAKMNKLWANDASFNDGTGIANNAIINAKVLDGTLSRTKNDWSTFSNNMKSATNGAGISLANSSQDLASNGLSISFTVSGACKALVTVQMGVSSTTDFEFRPEIRLGGTVVQVLTPSAAAGNASSRSSVRGFTAVVSLSAGVNVISAGVNLTVATSPNIAVGGAIIAAIVNGNVTA
jgi:hypothetical protein